MREVKRAKLYRPYGRCGPAKKWSEMTGPERWITSRRIFGGRRRAAFWRKLGFPNIDCAVEARQRQREAQRRLREQVPMREPIEGPVAGSASPLVRRLMLEIPAGLYDPAYLMRREMKILDLARRCPRGY